MWNVLLILPFLTNLQRGACGTSSITNFNDNLPSASVTLANDGPALLDANITFFAKLKFDKKHHEPKNQTYMYKFSDNSNPKMHKALRCHLNCNYITSYEEKVYPLPGHRVMNVTVLTIHGEEIAETSSSFQLTDKIPGSIIITQNGNWKNPVQSSLLPNKTANFTLYIHDPEGFLAKSNKYYLWYLNNHLMSYNSWFNNTFNQTGPQTILVSIFALVWDYHSTGVSAIKRGSFTRNFQVTDPINVTIAGKTVLKHGEVIRLNVTCAGSAPFLYCWNIYHPNQTVPKPFACSGPVVTTSCEFSVIKYLPKSGSYKFLVNISNGIGSQVVQQEISILGETTGKSLISIIVPVVCSLFALAIIIWGIGFFVHTRNRYKIEVADFDFQTNASDLSYKTFFQRLKSSLFGGVTCFSTERSHLSHDSSSVSSYGSIQDPKVSTTASMNTDLGADDRVPSNDEQTN